MIQSSRNPRGQLPVDTVPRKTRSPFASVKQTEILFYKIPAPEIA